MIPLIQKEAADRHKWMTDEEIMEIVAIAESTPGPIAVNAATFTGYHAAGVPGGYKRWSVHDACVFVLRRDIRGYAGAVA